MDLKPDLPDSRLQALGSWCTKTLADVAGNTARPDLVAVSGDASFRRYFRTQAQGSGSFIAVDAPPERENCRSFVEIARSWREQGVRTPAVHSVDFQQGYMLLEDFGDQLLYSGLTPDSVDTLYRRAMTSLHQLQSTRLSGGYTLPAYDQAFLGRELGLFREWFLKGLLDYPLTRTDEQMLDTLFDQLIASALEQPSVPVHRDYHSRNIMMLPDGLGLIDFQDAVRGPATYDLVSLLRDCYIDWPDEKVYQWLDSFAQQSPYLSQVDTAVLQRWFDWMGLQRHMKVLGIFVRLWLRDGKPAYLGDIPRVYAYVVNVSSKYPEIKPFSDWLSDNITPRLRQCDWWQDYQLRN